MGPKKVSRPGLHSYCRKNYPRNSKKVVFMCDSASRTECDTKERTHLEGLTSVDTYLVGITDTRLRDGRGHRRRVTV